MIRRRRSSSHPTASEASRSRSGGGSRAANGNACAVPQLFVQTLVLHIVRRPRPPLVPHLDSVLATVRVAATGSSRPTRRGVDCHRASPHGPLRSPAFSPSPWPRRGRSRSAGPSSGRCRCPGRGDSSPWATMEVHGRTTSSSAIDLRCRRWRLGSRRLHQGLLAGIGVFAALINAQVRPETRAAST